MKAEADDLLGRFREIVSDPLNILIGRHRQAGMIHEGMGILHNGNVVPIGGNNAYCGRFSDILVINRGVHEPLEEYVFQQLLEKLPQSPVMLELGSYWAHYSMWLKKTIPTATTFMVEPDSHNLHVGKENFHANGMIGSFINAFVGKGKFAVDDFLSKSIKGKLHILHADIQGFEVEMLEGCREALNKKMIDYIFVSTHSQLLHSKSFDLILGAGYRIEVSADFDEQTTSYDGFIFASSPEVKKILKGAHPLGRIEIMSAAPFEIYRSLALVSQNFFLPKSIRDPKSIHDWFEVAKRWLRMSIN